MHRTKSIVCALAVFALWFPAHQAGVQQPGANVLEEVLVTARRREESLQVVPISVVALDGEDLALRGLEQIEDLSARVPNVSLIGGGATGDAAGSFVMRGVRRA